MRRSRDRFWSGEQSADKIDAYWTLYECLLTTCKLTAPFVPFLAEEMWQNLAVAAFAANPVRILARPKACICATFPANKSAVDELLSRAHGLGPGNRIPGPGRTDRRETQGPPAVRRVEIVLADDAHQSWLAEHDALICDELNVKHMEFAAKADQYITYTILPDLKAPRAAPWQTTARIAKNTRRH